MTFAKMMLILEALWINGDKHGMVYATSGGEIGFDFTSQPSRDSQALLVSKGFIRNDDGFIYRPRKG